MTRRAQRTQLRRMTGKRDALSVLDTVVVSRAPLMMAIVEMYTVARRQLQRETIQRVETHRCS